jgi:hypothetical protein
LRRLIAVVAALILVSVSARVAAADKCGIHPSVAKAPLYELRLSNVPQCDNKASTAPTPVGKIVGAGIIYLYANDEAKYSSLNNVLLAIKQLEGKYIYPGETFSFNQAANLLQEDIPYELGPDVRNNLVKAGGVCMVSTMIATAAHDAGLPFVNGSGKIIPRPIPHSRFFKYYHQVNLVNNHAVAITEAAVAIRKDNLGEAWKTVLDMRFINNTGRVLVLHFEPSFTEDDLDLSQPFGLIRQTHTLQVELRAVPNGLDGWLSRLEHFSMN